MGPGGGGVSIVVIDRLSGIKDSRPLYPVKYNRYGIRLAEAYVGLRSPRPLRTIGEFRQYSDKVKRIGLNQ